LIDSDIWTQELRLTSIASGSVQWTAGGFFRHAQIDQHQPGIYFGLPDPSGAPLLPVSFPYQALRLSKSWAVFGDVSYELTDRLVLGTGLRYFEDDQESTIDAFQAGSFHALNPRVYAQYKLTDEVNTYASAAKGFRSGGFNALNQPSYDPETVWTYELGTKMSLIGGHLSADLAVFYSDYKDYQIEGILPAPAPPLSITSNAGSAKIKGIEWGLTWRPTEQWSLSFNGDYVDSEFTKINVTSSSHAVGDPLDLFPKYGYTVSGQRDLRWNGRKGFARLDYNQQGRATQMNRSFGPWFHSESDIINMLNFNMSLQWSDNLSLSLFGENLLDDRGLADAYGIFDLASRSRPRTFGVGFGVTFD
jgi:iron complex outermembrane receptor protein